MWSVQDLWRPNKPPTTLDLNPILGLPSIQDNQYHVSSRRWKAQDGVEVKGGGWFLLNVKGWGRFFVFSLLWNCKESVGRFFVFLGGSVWGKTVLLGEIRLEFETGDPYMHASCSYQALVHRLENESGRQMESRGGVWLVGSISKNRSKSLSF